MNSCPSFLTLVAVMERKTPMCSPFGMEARLREASRSADSTITRIDPVTRPHLPKDSEESGASDDMKEFTATAPVRGVPMLQEPRHQIAGLTRDADRALKAMINEYRGNDYIMSPSTIPAAITIDSKKEGPRVLILGAVHGDEPCGAFAVHELLHRIMGGDVPLLRGQLTLGIGNPQALSQDVRYVKENLNRLCLEPTGSETPINDERQRAQELMGLIRGQQYLLDLHSTRLPTDPYLIAEAEVLSMARTLGFPNIVSGWGALNSGALAGDTEGYGLRHGVTSFTAECGQHDAPLTFLEAIEAAKRLLAELHMIPAYPRPHAAAEPTLHTIASAYLKPPSGFHYAPALTVRNFAQVREGEVIGYAGEEPVLAPFAASLVLPKDPQRMQVGEELFLLARCSPPSGTPSPEDLAKYSF